MRILSVTINEHLGSFTNPSVPTRMLVSFFSLSLLSLAAGAPQIQLGNTTLIGRDVTLLNQEFYGGIPFTEPPLGGLRLKPPVLKTHLNVTTFDASNFGFACLQPEQQGITTNIMSEDCLTINVFRPAGLPANASLPVMAWIYGGGFVGGASLMFNGSGIIAQSVARGTPIIYVNFNYRLGPLGFPQGQEATNRGALNLALRDQLAGLEWIQANIATFGGDKTKVTVFGESAGAISIANLFLTSSLPKLARAAIFESGSAASGPLFNATRREFDWQNFVEAVPQCASTAGTQNTFDCLRTVSNSSVLLDASLVALSKANEASPWYPTIDGPGGLIPDLPSRLFEKGQFARLPFVAGTNLDEATLLIPTTINSTQELRAIITAYFTPSPVGPDLLQDATDRLLELYPDIPALGSPFNTGNETFGLSSQYKRLAAIGGDLNFQSQRRLWIQAASNADVKTFSYLFTDPQTNGPPELGVFHSSEIPYVYGDVVNGTAAANHLSSIMTDYWVSFATSLDPNDGRGNQRPNWAQYTPDNHVIIQLNGENTTLIPDTYRAEQMNFINSMPVVFRH